MEQVKRGMLTQDFSPKNEHTRLNDDFSFFVLTDSSCWLHLANGMILDIFRVILPMPQLFELLNWSTPFGRSFELLSSPIVKKVMHFCYSHEYILTPMLGSADANIRKLVTVDGSSRPSQR
jgi:hypothetical protein